MRKKKEKLDKSILVDGKLSPEARKVFEESLARSNKALEPWLERLRDSRRLTAADYSITINCRD